MRSADGGGAIQAPLAVQPREDRGGAAPTPPSDQTSAWPGSGPTPQPPEQTDAWPALYERVQAADILVLGSPIWRDLDPQTATEFEALLGPERVVDPGLVQELVSARRRDDPLTVGRQERHRRSREQAGAGLSGPRSRCQ